ncbi:MAG: prepilin-type N-terminal cleavage/methylation domain-containing protein [FCB group bacterium]|nr:prepilin-type N-terminal cleavage/methylation domain-containing protein [FCB group bacterium]MBL7029440.1 prepilin-type N-terminal cleavage/methylation domain-containing protein [Candidatus Neomarinimicrobiota bacterium]MBL7123164.1 prepilin-type N-terminal cleavage/methylation domain-containing protein [Candidatus Neomarinimicrobiota bacterium]
MTTNIKQFFRSLPSVRDNVSGMVSGFSLVELMIVIAVTSLSVAVTVPIYSSNVMKAKLSEADANLGSIRTQLRIYYGHNNEYPKAESAALVVGATWNDINTGQLNGKYFDDSSYTYVSEEGIEFTITCVAKSMLDSDRTLDESGNLAGGN